MSWSKVGNYNTAQNTARWQQENRLFCSPNVLHHSFYTSLQPACCNSIRRAPPRNRTTSTWPFLAATIRGLCSIIGAALVFVGTGLNQKLDNLHPNPPEIGQLQGAHSQLLCTKALLQYLWCLGLCWHPT